MGNPFRRGSRVGLLQHTVNLLQAQTLGLGNQKIGVDEAGSAERAPDEEDAGLQIGFSRSTTDHVRGDDRDDAVPEPVRRGGKRNATSTNRQREDLANQNPSS